MAEVKTAGVKSATGESGMSKATPTQQDQTLALRLTPVNNSDQLVLANTSNVQLAPGVAHFDINQVRAVCACFASVCGTVDRHDTAGVFRSGVVLELKRPQALAGGVSGLLQLASGASVTGRCYACRAGWWCGAGACKAGAVWLAGALSWVVSDAGCGLIWNSPPTG